MPLPDWYNTHKRIALAVGTLALIIILSVFFWPRKTAVQPSPTVVDAVDAVDAVARAEQKSGTVNYLAEYDEQFSRNVGGVSESYDYKIREIKKGANWKKETYINDLTLLESHIRSEGKFFHCVTYPDIMCAERADANSVEKLPARDALRAGLSLWKNKNIFQTTVAAEQVAVEGAARAGVCVSYTFNPDAVSDEDVAELMAAIGGPTSTAAGTAAYIKDWLKEYTASACFDNETGVALTYHATMRQSIPASSGKTIDYSSEDTQTITRLRLNPLLSADEFSIK